MDPVANINEQRQLSSEIIELIDGHTHDDGTVEGGAAQLVADRANRLSELVQALDGWRQGGGFDPYSAPSPEASPSSSFAYQPVDSAAPASSHERHTEEVSFRLAPHMVSALSRLAEREQTSVSEVVREALCSRWGLQLTYGLRT